MLDLMVSVSDNGSHYSLNACDSDDVQVGVEVFVDLRLRLTNISNIVTHDLDVQSGHVQSFTFATISSARLFFPFHQ